MARSISKFNKILSAGLYEIMVLLLLRNSPLPLYGYQIVKELKKVSKGTLKPRRNVIYTILKRLEHDGIVKGKWVSSEDRPKRKYYIITERGEKYLEKILRRWAIFARTIMKLRRYRSFSTKYEGSSELYI